MRIPRAGGKLESRLVHVPLVTTPNEIQNDDDGRCFAVERHDYATVEEEKNAVAYYEI